MSTSLIKTDGPMIDMVGITKQCPFTFYDKKKFAAITIRMGDPNCTALLFTSGKLVITGGTSWYECLLAAKYVCRLLKTIFPVVNFWVTSCDIQNIVGKSAIPMQEGCFLDIKKMYEEMNEMCTYQRTMFPGLIYRPEKSPVVILCFTSGRIVITGGKTPEDVYIGWKRLWCTVQKYITSKTAANSSS